MAATTKITNKHPDKATNEQVGARIKARRAEMGLSRDKIAARSGISSRFIFSIEAGEKGISAETLYGIAKALEVSCDWILFGEDKY